MIQWSVGVEGGGEGEWWKKWQMQQRQGIRIYRRGKGNKRCILLVLLVCLQSFINYACYQGQV